MKMFVHFILAVAVVTVVQALSFKRSFILRNAFHSDPFAGKVRESFGCEAEIRAILAKCGYQPFVQEEPFKLESFPIRVYEHDVNAFVGDCTCWATLNEELPISFCSSPPQSSHILLGDIKLSFSALVTSVCDVLLKKANPVMSNGLHDPLPLNQVKCIFVNGGDETARDIQLFRDEGANFLRGLNLNDVLVDAANKGGLSYETKKNVTRQFIQDNKINIFHTNFLSKEYFDEIRRGSKDMKAELAKIVARFEENENNVRGAALPLDTSHGKR